MAIHVLLEHIPQSEPAPTVCTLVRFLSCVDGAVFVELTALSEGFTTDRTHVGFEAGVSQPVDLQVVEVTIQLPTVGTLVALPVPLCDVGALAAATDGHCRTHPVVSTSCSISCRTYYRCRAIH